jgi:DNA-binding winged helix-turn-helix (wHTH) protein
MTAPQKQVARLRFHSFELDLATGELFKNGRRLRLQDQPARLLVLLVRRPGELVTRTEIQEPLWGQDQFVEFEHAINTAIRKIRETLEDDSENPRLIETLPRKGYRFIGKIDQDILETADVQVSPMTVSAPARTDQFSLPSRLARRLFLLVQVGYLAMYVAALYYISGVERVLGYADFVSVRLTFPAVLVVAMCGIAVRLYLLSAVGWAHPAAGLKFRRLFPYLFVLDCLWAASPLLAFETLGPGVALAGVAGMVYLPFAQRTLMSSISGTSP